MKRLTGFIAMIAAALGGCGSAPVESAADTAAKPGANTARPAVLAQPSAATSAALSTAIAKALNGTKVSLASDVFTKSHQLILERNAQDPAGMAGLNGRLLGVPEMQRFSLSIRNQQCYLRYENSGKETMLSGIQCKAQTAQ